MPKNNLNSWVGTTMQPQFQTYQTAGMLQPQAGQTGQPLGPPPPVTPPPPPPPPSQGVVNTPPPVGLPAFPSPLPPQQQDQPTGPLPPLQPPTTGNDQRDRLVEVILRNQPVLEF